MNGKIRLCVNTQTPLVRFRIGYPELLEKYGKLGSPVDLAKLIRGEDYEYTPGGVTAMVFPLLKRLVTAKFIKPPLWISLGPNAPTHVLVDGIRLYNVTMEDNEIPLYASFKEGIWNEIHGFGRLEFKPDEYKAYVTYNWLCAKVMLDLLKDTDLYFIHDFQQLLTGILLGPSAPAIFRWHIPFRLEGISERLRTLVLKSVEGFDVIIVSTRRDLEGLIHSGYRGKAYQVYPYVDPKPWGKPSRRSIQSTIDRFRLKHGPVLLVVGRMDRIKSQDVAIEAAARLVKTYPALRLVLVGNGSFTGSGSGGLSHPKAETWREELEGLAANLRINDNVIFTGHASDEAVKCLYNIADAVVVPSRTEGFNLTTVEAWLCKKPVVVSTGAGSSELVNEDVNGYTFAQGDSVDLARKLTTVLSRPERAEKMGEYGFNTARRCSVDNATSKLQSIFEQCMSMYKTERRSKISPRKPRFEAVEA